MAAGNNTPKAELLPYDSLFPPGEAQKAAQRVLDDIAEHQKQLDRLRLFAAENTDLINLVRKLPDDTSHDIMVPFGKAAFFPGRLIHTNELLVLLGEGYYADQTAKQTVGVLKRRGQVLESKVEALGAMISDLKARADFFGATAGESVEGIVEIREFEEHQFDKTDDDGLIDPNSLVSSEDIAKETITDEEYAQILARSDELEKAELAAEGISSDDEGESAETKIYHNFDDRYHKNIEVQKPKNSEIPHMDQVLRSTGRGEATSGMHPQSISVQSYHGNPRLQLGDTSYQVEVCSGDSADHELGSNDDSMSKRLDSNQSFTLPVAPKDNIKKEQVPKHKEPVSEASTMSYSHHKAFTGTIVEHSDGLDSSLSSPTSYQATASKPSRPVSRFRMQKGR